MKKFLLASVCLLALTACSQGQQGKESYCRFFQARSHSKPKRSKSKPRPLLATSAITTKTKFKLATRMMRLFP